MKGHINGVQAHMKRQYPTVIYIHCASHVLNLIVSKASNVADIANYVSTIVDITTFVRGSTKRLKALQQSSKSWSTSMCRSKSINSVCETRWVDRHKNITKFVKMFPAVFDALEGMAEWSGNIAASKASQYLCAMLFPKFIVSLCVCARFLRLLSRAQEKLELFLTLELFVTLPNWTSYSVQEKSELFYKLYVIAKKMLLQTSKYYFLKLRSSLLTQ